MSNTKKFAAALVLLALICALAIWGPQHHRAAQHGGGAHTPATHHPAKKAKP